MNLTNLITEAQRLAGRVDTQWNERTTRWLNEAQEVWCSAIPWPNMQYTEDFTVMTGGHLHLPLRVYTIRAISDLTNKRYLKPWEGLDRDFPENHLAGTTGAPLFWRELGNTPTAKHISAPTRLVIQPNVSLAATVYIAGLVETTAASGSAEHYDLVREAISVINSSSVTSANVYSRIDNIGKDTVTSQAITVWDTSSNVVARIPGELFQSVYREIEFLPIPTVGTTLRVTYQFRPTQLSQAYHVPNIGVDTEFLIWYAASMIHSAQGDEVNAQAKLARAQETLQRHVYQERMFGDKDLSSAPEPGYWNFEDQFEFPLNE